MSGTSNTTDLRAIFGLRPTSLTHWRGSSCPVLTQQCLFKDLRGSKLHFLIALFHGSPYKFNYNLIYCQALLRGSQPPPKDNAAHCGRKAVPEKHPNIKEGFRNCCFEMQWDTVASDGKCNQIIRTRHIGPITVSSTAVMIMC